MNDTIGQRFKKDGPLLPLKGFSISRPGGRVNGGTRRWATHIRNGFPLESIVPYRHRPIKRKVVVHLDAMQKVYLGVLVIVALDYLTGIVKAVATDSFNSGTMRQGLVHKLAYLVAFILVYVVENFINPEINIGLINDGVLTVLLVTWITLTEIGSILENLCEINPELADNSFMAIFAKKGDVDNGD